MASYIFAICATSIISAVICIAAPDKYCKFISFVSGIAIMAVVISPLKNIGEINISVPRVNEDTEITADSAQAAKALAHSVYEVIDAKYSCKEQIEIITVRTSDNEQFEPVCIEITVIPDIALNTASLENYLKELYGIDINVNENTT